MINALNLAKVIINMIVHYHEISESIIMDRDLQFILKFRFLFLIIIKKLSTAFYPQTDDQKEKQNNMMKVYLKIFVN